MKTRDGKKILLDLEKVALERPGVHSLAVFTSLGVLFFLYLPLGLFMGIKVGGAYSWNLFYFALLAIPAAGVAMHFALTKYRHPMAINIYSYTCISSASFYSAAFFMFACMSGVSCLDLWFIPVLWLAVELNAYRLSSRNSDADLITYFRRQFKLNEDGNYLFHLENTFLYRLKGTKKVPDWLYWLENSGGILIFIVGPGLFITSAVLKNNFDPRYAIAGGIAFLIAPAFRPVSTEFYTLRRALKLKQQGAF
ncbi:hypothetical protein [Marinomonas mediterranea]|uniref:hypothetical protein n=1 Tax=Marinomonas mediterranea TaxID=119864 RepID=UPI00234A0D53|nr:hypothetical protein [Marinomonas mediterranea]WCN07578.1 hypothetical protein GV055_00885 [Marinomonas mediterranea]WCN11676.1 hypothetical protein GV054_00895 [Marinomonas mediterranea]